MFVILEGIDGSGKSTQLALLKQAYPKAYFTYEPGGDSPILQQTRDIFFNSSWNSLEQTMLLLAMRSLHWRSEILPRLNQGQDIFCDRFILSSYVYQGKVAQIGVQKIRALHKLVFEDGDINTGGVILLDIDPKLAMERKKNTQENHFDRGLIQYYQILRENYLYFAKQPHSRIQVIDASKSTEDVFKSIHTYIKNNRDFFEKNTNPYYDFPDFK